MTTATVSVMTKAEEGATTPGAARDGVRGFAAASPASHGTVIRSATHGQDRDQGRGDGRDGRRRQTLVPDQRVLAGSDSASNEDVRASKDDAIATSPAMLENCERSPPGSPRRTLPGADPVRA